ncbi:hypothetical protein LP420_25840 [Massilia sp. B-10]|nr:hypothetical protein LP420_25840 [Massilia sp. B-10]UUZ52630.1 hypothetical protein LP419_25330 [Massilia sp. H-1]
MLRRLLYQWTAWSGGRLHTTKKQKQGHPTKETWQEISLSWGKSRYLLCNFFKGSSVMHVG